MTTTNMKKLLIFLCVLFFATTISAQNPVTYHAIDGTTWVTKFDRDRKERLLWDKVDLDLKTALISGRLGSGEDAKSNYESLKQSFQKCKDALANVRLADSGSEIVQNPEFRIFLQYNGVTVRNGMARNNEFFNFEEYAYGFDAVLSEYNFNSEILSELADQSGKEYNLKFFVNDFVERMELVNDKIDSEKEIVRFKRDIIMKLTPQFLINQQKIKEQENKNRRK